MGPFYTGRVFIEGGWYDADELAKILAGCWIPMEFIGGREIALVGEPGGSAVEAIRFNGGPWICDCGVIEPQPTHFIPYPAN